MSAPSFQFYPGDWRKNANLRRCSPAARGVWIDVLCTLHDSDTYGLVRWPLADLANAAGAPLKLLKELVDKSVLKGCDRGNCEPYVYIPKSGRREGDPVVLVPAQKGPIWFSSRMVKDEYVRTVRGASVKQEGGSGETPKQTPKDSPKGGFGEGSGGGIGPYTRGRSSSSSSSASASSSIDDDVSPPEVAPTRQPVVDVDGRMSRAIEITRLLRQRQIGVTASNPDVLAWAEEGIEDDRILEAVATATENRAAERSMQPINSRYLDAILRNSGGAPVQAAPRDFSALKARLKAEEAARDR